MLRLSFTCLSAGALLALAPAVSAQPVAPEQHTEEAPEEMPAESTVGWTTTAGGLLNTGNTESWQLNVASDFQWVRLPHAVTASLGLNVGRANVEEDMSDDLVDTVKNLNARLRYDYFFTEMDALFAGAIYRWDPLAGLDRRVQGQVGYLRKFFSRENHRFWGEIGYDLTYDNFHPDPLIDPETMMQLDGTAVVHSARGFLGYYNKLNPAVTFETGLEGLVNVEDAEDTRINWDNALRSSINERLKAELKFSLRFDNVPVPGAVKTDTQTQVTLIYTLI